MAKTVKVAKVGVKKKPGFLYFVDKQGDISMVAMNRGGKKKSRKKTAKKSTKRKTTKRKATKKKTTKRRRR